MAKRRGIPSLSGVTIAGQYSSARSQDCYGQTCHGLSALNIAKGDPSTFSSQVVPVVDLSKTSSKASSVAAMRALAASFGASAATLRFGVRARVALMFVTLSDMKSSTRYSARALLSDDVVEEEDRFFELTSRVSAIVWNVGNTCEVFYLHTLWRNL